MKTETPAVLQEEKQILYRIRDLVIRYDRNNSGPPALVCQHMDLFEGETVFLTGPNGSGKSTFLKVLNALVGPTAGSVGYRGGADVLARETVYLHQNPYIFSGTVDYNVGFACKAMGLPVAQVLARAESALGLVGLSGYSARRHRQLSGGEAQRVALARVIASGAKVFLLDEPTASADAESAKMISAALLCLVQEGKTLVMSTHDPLFMLDFSTVQSVCGYRTIGFSRGTIISGNLPGPNVLRPVRHIPDFTDHTDFPNEAHAGFPNEAHAYESNTFGSNALGSIAQPEVP